MTEKVNFKVYVIWRENEKPEVRRLVLEKIFLSRFCHLNFMLQDVYPGLKTKTYTVAWKDDDGDEIVVSSDVEMVTALDIWRGDVIKLYVYCKQEDIKDDKIAGNSNKLADNLVVHNGVFCDVCGGNVVGFRYKCGVCDNYDLCSRCEAVGHHPEHSMVRISTPRSRTTFVPQQQLRAVHAPSSMCNLAPCRHHICTHTSGSTFVPQQQQLRAVNAPSSVFTLTPYHHMHPPPAVSRPISSSSTSLQFRLGLPALDVGLAFNNNENRFM